VKWVVISDDAVNNLLRDPPATSTQLIGALRQLIDRAHRANVKVICSTLTPFNASPEIESTRQEVNAFVQDSSSGCDARATWWTTRAVRLRIDLARMASHISTCCRTAPVRSLAATSRAHAHFSRVIRRSRSPRHRPHQSYFHALRVNPMPDRSSIIS